MRRHVLPWVWVLAAAGLLAVPAVPQGQAPIVATAPSRDDAAAALARRRAALDDLVAILGPTANPPRVGRNGAPFLLGFLAAFQRTQTSPRVTAYDQTWEAWQQRTGELPPDFEALPSQPELPDPLVMLDDGRTRITTAAQWAKQRQQIRAAFEHWIYGRMPPPPGNTRGTVTATTFETDVRIEDVQLEFGPDHRGKLHVQLMIPPGPGPFPVFVTDHPRLRPWSNVGVRRGYIACIYDALDDSYIGRDDSNGWIDLYPDYDFARLARWAWGAMRAVDYLETLPIVERRHIAIAGHSRNSKQALLAAAFDERFGAVVSSRGNAADSLPIRFNTYPFISEPLEEMTDGILNYFSPRLRFFVGHEDRLPVDMNLLQALVAPRALLLSHAYTEHQANVFAVEQSYRSVKRVYGFLGQPNRVGLYQQPGEHPASVEDIETYFDFFDTVFGRRARPIPENWVFDYSFERWQKLSGETINPLAFPKRAIGDFAPSSPAVSASAWPARLSAIQNGILWALGRMPSGPRYPPVPTIGTSSQWTSEGFLGDMLPRPAEQMSAADISFGDALKGELYLPAGKTATPAAGEKWPIVIWLHPYSYGTGYSRYAFWAPLVESGFAVMAFDQIGFGSRANQARQFYDRYPHWSLLGKMVADTRAAIDAVTALKVADTSRVYIAGFGLGAEVALVTAALDDRVRALAVGVGFAPLRLDRAGTGSEGLRHYSHLHGLLPRFGFFVGHEDRLPIDFDEILAAIAPRPVFVIAPTLDRYHPVGDVRQAVDAANRVYAAFGSTRVELVTPREFSRFPNEIQKPAYDWIAAQAGITQPPPKGGGR